jgi:hypothetical protein
MVLFDITISSSFSSDSAVVGVVVVGVVVVGVVVVGVVVVGVVVVGVVVVGVVVVILKEVLWIVKLLNNKKTVKAKDAMGTIKLYLTQRLERFLLHVFRLLVSIASSISVCVQGL